MAVVVVLVLAAWFRLAHLGLASLGHDEAARANITYNAFGEAGPYQSFFVARSLPPLHLLMGWAVQHGLGRSECLLRLPYALAGLGCVTLVYGFTRRQFGPGAAVLAAAVAAAHPALILFSKTVKVFSLESLASIALLWLGFEAYLRPSRRSLLLFAGVGAVALGFTYTAPLLIGAWGTVFVWTLLRGKAPYPTPRRHFLVAAGVLGLAGLASFAWLAGGTARDVTVKYYEVTQHAWPANYAPGELLRWASVKGFGLLEYVLGLTQLWSPLKWTVGTISVLALAASAGTVWRCNRALAAFAALLAAEVVAAAALRLWPMGDCQTATFLVPLVAVAVGVGLWQLVCRLGRSPATPFILALAVFVPAARATKATLCPAPPEQHLRPAFEAVAAHLQPGDALFVHYEAKVAYGFYWRETGYPAWFQPYSDRDNLAAFTDHFRACMAEHPRVWFVFLLRRPAEAGPWLEHVRSNYRIRDEYRYNDAAAYLVERPTRT